MDLLDNYDAVIARKSLQRSFEPAPCGELAPHLFPFQRDLVGWALRRGRAAIFADCGLGKGPMLLEWSRQVSEAGRVLILAPLAVSDQLGREALKFGVDARVLREDDGKSPIVITNYEIAERYDASRFVGVVADESSIMKAHTGATRNLLIERFAQTPYRLACTATPAPNDFTELGNHSEFLGALSRVEMLAEHFVHDGGSTQDWRLKGHAVEAFWTWVASWGAVVRTPAALGYDASAYVLPPLRIIDHVLKVDHSEAWAAGSLFVADARSLNEQRAIRRATEAKRVETIRELVASEPDRQWLIFGELNDECDALEKAIPGAVQVSGSDDPEVKRDRLLGFAEGRVPYLVSKMKIAGFGMNFQGCSRIAFAGPTHSYEGFYQAIRRCWRFGQQNPVDVHVVVAENEREVLQNFRRKERDAETLAAETERLIGPAMRAAVGGTERKWNPYQPAKPLVVPGWLRGNE